MICTVDVIKCRCPHEISSKRDYHPGHQQSDLSQGVEVNPISTTPTKSSAPSHCVGVGVSV